MDNPTKYEHPDFFLFLNLYFFFGDCETRAKEEIGKNEPAKKGICHIPPVLFPDLNNLYQSRAERFQSLATAENPFSEYLIFASHVTRAQQNALYDNPLMMDITDILQQSMIVNKPPLDCKTFIRTDHWHKLFNC